MGRSYQNTDGVFLPVCESLKQMISVFILMFIFVVLICRQVIEEYNSYNFYAQRLNPSAQMICFGMGKFII